MALKQVFEFKGASGKVPCFCCKHVVLRCYAPSDMTALVYRDEVDLSKTKPHSNQSIFRFAQHLKAQSTVLNKGELRELESNIGMNYCHTVCYMPLCWSRGCCLSHLYAGTLCAFILLLVCSRMK